MPFQSPAFATGVPHEINAFHRYTMCSGLLSRPLANRFPMHFRGWAPGFHIGHDPPPAHALRPVNPINARRLCITAAAGTELAATFSGSTIKRQNLLGFASFSLLTAVYDPKAFILHAASHCQAFAHCK